MRIEDKWDDGVLYHIGFQVSLDGELRNIRKNWTDVNKVDTKIDTI